MKILSGLVGIFRLILLIGSERINEQNTQCKGRNGLIHVTNLKTKFIILTMKRVSYTIVVLIFLIGITGCGDDGSTSSESELNGLAVVLERTGDEEVEVSQGSFADADIGTVRFCYEGEGCEESSGGSTESWGGPTRYIMESSDPGKQAVGVIVEFEVNAGEGFAEIVRGESYEEEGFPRFDEGEAVETIDSFSEGDVIEFTYGETD